ncbi:MAG: HEAT repeat domain-containing protein [Mycobacteriales bacterium]
MTAHKEDTDIREAALPAQPQGPGNTSTSESVDNAGEPPATAPAADAADPAAEPAVVDLAGLDTVPWGRLRHAYGMAGDLPDLFRDAADPERSADALFALSARLYHQGGQVCPAASPSVPFLLRLAAEPSVPARVEVLRLLGALAEAGRNAPPRFVDPAWSRAFGGAVPGLVALLADPDPAVRREVAFPLTHAVEHAGAVLAAFRSRWAAEPDAAARLGLAIGAGQLVRELPPAEAAPVLEWLTGLREKGDSPADELAALLALRLATPPHAAAPQPRPDGEPDPDDPAVDLAEAADLVLTALHEGDLNPWTQAWCGPDSPRNVLPWVDQLLGDDVAGRTRLAVEMLGHADVDRRAGALRTAAEVASRWRSPVEELLPAVAGRLADPDPDLRAFAAYLLAACGRHAAPHVDALAALVDDPHPAVADAVLWALSGCGDERCAEPLAARLSGPRLGFALARGGGHGWTVFPPYLDDVLGPARPHAAALLPAVLSRLGATTPLRERRAFLRVLAGWGPAAAPAARDLEPLLDTDAAAWALAALAAMGPDADGQVTAERAAAVLVDPRLSRQEREIAVRAYYDLTGDPEPGLAHFVPRLEEPFPVKAVAFLAEVGAAALPYADRLRGLLRRGDGEGLPAAAGYALWRITGDPADAVPALISDVVPLLEGRPASAATMVTVRRLGEVGLAAGAGVPVLRAILDSDYRAVRPGQWDSVARDDELCQAISLALTHLTSG